MILESKKGIGFGDENYEDGRTRTYWCLVKAAIYPGGSTNKRGGPFLIHGQLTARYSVHFSRLENEGSTYLPEHGPGQAIRLDVFRL